MTSRSTLCLLAGLCLLVALTTARAAAEPCRVGFDGHLKTDAGQAPTVAEGVTFAKGKAGQAAVLGVRAKLAYPTKGTYEPKHGTVEVWVQRNSTSVPGTHKSVLGQRLRLIRARFEAKVLAKALEHAHDLWVPGSDPAIGLGFPLPSTPVPYRGGHASRTRRRMRW